VRIYRFIKRLKRHIQLLWNWWENYFTL